MEERSRLSAIMESISNWVEDQQWFQQLKSKWDELDAQSRLYLQFAGAGGLIVITLFGLLTFYWSVHRTRDELMAKSELLSTLNAATDELRSLQATNAAMPGAGGNEPWAAYFETLGGSVGITKANLTVSDGKAGASSDVSKESLFDISMKKVNIRQAVKLAQSLESGARPVKLRNLTIDTQPDLSGYLDVTLSVSAFALNAK